MCWPLLHVVWVGEIVLHAVKWHSPVDVVMFDPVFRLTFDLLEKLVVLALDIAPKFLTMIMCHIVVVVIVLSIVQGRALVVITIDRATVVISLLPVVLIIMRDRTSIIVI